MPWLLDTEMWPSHQNTRTSAVFPPPNGAVPYTKCWVEIGHCRAGFFQGRRGGIGVPQALV